MDLKYLSNFYHPCSLDDRLRGVPPVLWLVDTWGKSSLILVPEATFFRRGKDLQTCMRGIDERENCHLSLCELS